MTAGRWNSWSSLSSPCSPPGLTLVSGFGLGTLLLPAFAVFFPIDAAVAMTAVVHLLNNLFKLALLGRQADRGVILRFGVARDPRGPGRRATPDRTRASMPPLATHALGEITWVKLVVGDLMVVFAVVELRSGRGGRTSTGATCRWAASSAGSSADFRVTRARCARRSWSAPD